MRASICCSMPAWATVRLCSSCTRRMQRRMAVTQITTTAKNQLQRTIQPGSEDGAHRRLINVRRETMAAVSGSFQERGIHEETSTGTTGNIGTAMPMGSHHSTARILPIRAAVIPQVRKLDRPVFMALVPLFAFLYYSPHLMIQQGLCLFASCCIHPHDAQRLSTPEQM